MSNHDEVIARRRQFLTWMAASPLLTVPGVSSFAAENSVSAPNRLPDPIMWSPRTFDNLITSPKEAINVFDFEAVARAKVPPAHFGYMAAGIDDDMTLRANREAFLKYYLRPRRMVDVSKVDTSIEIFGIKYDSPIFISPTGGNKAYHADGELGVSRAAKLGNHLQILSTAATTSIDDAVKTRGAPVWFQLYATSDRDVAYALTRRAEKIGRAHV